MSTSGKRPVIIGVGQAVNRPGEGFHPTRPETIITKAVRQAEEDSKIKSLASRIDALCLVNCFSWPAEDPATDLAGILGAAPTFKAYTWVGATAPQWFVNQTAQRIIKGESRLALICGGEALYSRKMAADKNNRKSFPDIPVRKDWMAGDLRDPLTALELKYGLMLPINIYPLYENALRYNKGLSLTEHRQELADFCASLSSIAASNPYSWFSDRKNADEILASSSGNRMVSWPYTKLMCSIIDVDQAAALFMTDEKTADELGAPQENRIYLCGAGDASGAWYVSHKNNYYSSPSVKIAVDSALREANTSLDKIDHLDFYSCFPAATRITAATLGLSRDDRRNLTVTGGMPYFGGPGNNYSLHAICRMMEILRKDPTKTGMVHALSWFISKHSVGIYSGDPGSTEWIPLPAEENNKKDNATPSPDLAEEANGPGKVETYTLFHDREGTPRDITIIGRLSNNNRFIAKSEASASILESITKEEFIGTTGRLTCRDGINYFNW